MVVLGIETTCDETAAAVVERSDAGQGKILSNIVLSQVNEHAIFGGVVPEIAARAHVETLDHVIAQAMAAAARRPRTMAAWASARGLPRVPIRSSVLIATDGAVDCTL